MTTDAGTAALLDHWQQQMRGYDYGAQRQEPQRVTIAGSPVSQPMLPGTPVDELAGSAETPFGIQLMAQLGVLAGAVGQLAQQTGPAARGIPWSELHPFDLPFASSSQSAAAGQTLTSETWGPRTGYIWDVTRITVQGLSSGFSSSTATGTGTIVAGAGSATLPSGDSVTGFTLSFSAAPSTTGTATLTGVVGAPIVYDIPAGQTSPYTVNFPAPIAAAGTPTLTIAGLGTGAGAIVIYGTASGTSPDVVTIYKAPVAAAIGAVPLAAIGSIQGSGNESDLLSPRKGAFLLQPGDAILVAGAYNAANIAVSGSGIELVPHRLAEYLS